MSMLAGLMFFLVRLLLALIPPLALCYDSKKTAAVFAILMSAVYLVISGAEIPSPEGIYHDIYRAARGFVCA